MGDQTDDKTTAPERRRGRRQEAKAQQAQLEAQRLAQKAFADLPPEYSDGALQAKWLHT
jgi:hypothetical protein